MRKNGILAILAMLFLFVSCRGSSSGTDQSSGDDGSTSDVSGQQVYRQYCKNCHGADGTMELNNAANLATSEMAEEDMRNIIRNGKGMMMAYKNVLSGEEIDSVIAYTKTLRNE